jgi:hypothetical protein
MSAPLNKRPMQTKPSDAVAGPTAPVAVDRAGGARYVPTSPRVSAVQRVVSPCMYEERATDGKRAYWLWKCDRTKLPNVKKCALHRVQDEKMEVVPINCIQEYVKVLNGFQVDKQTESDPVTGASITSQTIYPEVDIYGATRLGRHAGPAIPYSEAPRVDLQSLADIPPREGIREAQFRRFTESDVGGGETKRGGAAPKQGGSAAVKPKRGGRERKALKGGSAPTAKGGAAEGGAVHLPSRSALRREKFKLTDQDLDEMELGAPAGFMRQPAEWTDPLNGLPILDGKSGNIEFYAYDDNYGSARNVGALQNGFDFSFRYLPYTYMTNSEYLEWLVTLQYDMRSKYPDFMLANATYDPALDSIATVETSILVALGRLETAKKYFNRQELFKGAEKFKNVMHKYLRRYAFAERTPAWYSPLSERYLAGSVTAPLYDGEKTAMEKIRGLNDIIGGRANRGNGLEDPNAENVGIKIPLKYRRLGGEDGAGPSDVAPEDNQIMAVIEDAFLTMLARLQYDHGYAVNVNNGILAPFVGTKVLNFENVSQPNENGLMNMQQRRFLTRELVRYFETFSLENVPEIFISLPGLRKEQAKALGLALPPAAINKYATEWRAESSTSFPTQLAPARTQIYLGSPRVTEYIS